MTHIIDCTKVKEANPMQLDDTSFFTGYNHTVMHSNGSPSFAGGTLYSTHIDDSSGVLSIVDRDGVHINLFTIDPTAITDVGRNIKFSGTTPPSDDLGQPGDFYIQFGQSDIVLWGAKGDSGWPEYGGGSFVDVPLSSYSAVGLLDMSQAAPNTFALGAPTQSAVLDMQYTSAPACTDAPNKIRCNFLDMSVSHMQALPGTPHPDSANFRGRGLIW